MFSGIFHLTWAKGPASSSRLPGWEPVSESRLPCAPPAMTFPFFSSQDYLLVLCQHLLEDETHTGHGHPRTARGTQAGLLAGCSRPQSGQEALGPWPRAWTSLLTHSLSASSDAPPPPWGTDRCWAWVVWGCGEVRAQGAMETHLRQMLGPIYPLSHPARQVLSEMRKQVQRREVTFLRPHSHRGQTRGLNPILPAHEHCLLTVFGGICAPGLD